MFIFFFHSVVIWKKLLVSKEVKLLVDNQFEVYKGKQTTAANFEKLMFRELTLLSEQENARDEYSNHTKAI